MYSFFAGKDAAKGESTQDVSPIGVAIIGSGIFAKEQHLPAVLATPSLSLKAVYSRSLKSAATLCEKLAQKVDWYSEETETDGRGLDDILPIPYQPAYIKKALLAGKHVLAEKPIAKDVATAEELLTWYKTSCDSGGIDPAKATFNIAENWRFLESHNYAATVIAGLGRVTGFRSRINFMVETGGKYFETPWRKTPEYQGGFLLDAGIHYVAATRLFIGKECSVVRVSAFTQQLQPHLPPVDTVNAVWKLANGASGTFAVSFGTTFKGSGYSVACEKGTVTVVRNRVSVVRDDKEETREFIDETNEIAEEGKGVKQEVAAWAKGIAEGTQDPRLAPTEALTDLKILEAMLRSGEHDGNPVAVAP
ncbi:hypothetical protein FH972_024555 [Carpinus fangiana]|uniref:Gfo/Idh/MocA-like oxidoreductase N-terminal domain-containing protein n=1 Tax=Carpinus fangiana TaxID=176857 RepID=A0A5N6KYN8_9ROSI|nr:hypothetical protein FH972_024555 [Carpinus fangiana]